MYADVLVIGAGVVGCAVSREMSRYEGSVLVLDRGMDLSEGASKANSGIVHAGFDAVPHTNKAFFNVEGAKMYPALCEEMGVPYRKSGALVLGFSQEDRKTLEKLRDQGKENGVEGLRILEKEEVLSMEKNTNPDVLCALYAPSSGIVSPYEMTFALANHAALNGAEFRFNEEVKHIQKTKDGLWQVQTDEGKIYTCKILINCAGVSSAMLHNQICSTKKYHIIPRRGEYYLLDHMDNLPFEHTMFQCPTKMGKGVLVSPTVHGNTLLGPSAEDIEDDRDTDTTQKGLDFVLSKSRLTWKNVNTRRNITNFSGIRAHEEGGDFVIGLAEGQKNAYETVGIESPGLSAAPAIAKYLCKKIAGDQKLKKKENFVPPFKKKKPFSSMNAEEMAQAIEENPLYGNLICRCEKVTEAEIRNAIREPVGAATVDGVKRRTRAGMGRCQGGFCSTRVAEILAEELHIPLTEVTKCGKNSRLLTGTLEEALKEADKNA